MNAHKTAVCIISTNGNRANLILDPVVVDRQFPVIQKLCQCSPALEAVIKRLGSRRAVRDSLALQQHPLLKCVRQWFGLGLADLQPLIDAEVFDLTLDVIELTDIGARLPGNLALGCHMQIKELAARMRHASSLCDATCKSRFVPRVIVAHQATSPFAQECSAMLTRPRFAKIVDHRLQIFKRSWRIGPKVSSVCLLVAGFEHLHRCLVGMHNRVTENLCFERIHQRLQLHATNAHPLGQGRARDFYTGAAKDALLAVQRQMVAVFGNQHLCQQARSRNALVNDLGWHWCLGQGFTVGTGPLATDMLLHGEHAWCVVQLL